MNRVKRFLMIITLVFLLPLRAEDKLVLSNMPLVKDINFEVLAKIFSNLLYVYDIKVRSVGGHDKIDGKIFLIEQELEKKILEGYTRKKLNVFNASSEMEVEKKENFSQLVLAMLERYLQQRSEYKAADIIFQKRLKESPDTVIDDRVALRWCGCDLGPEEIRFELILRIALESLEKYSLDQKIKYASLASGNLLQDYLQIAGLIDVGFSSFDINLFDLDYGDRTMLGETSQEVSEGLKYHINKFGERQIKNVAETYAGQMDYLKILLYGVLGEYHSELIKNKDTVNKFIKITHWQNVASMFAKGFSKGDILYNNSLLEFFDIAILVDPDSMPFVLKKANDDFETLVYRSSKPGGVFYTLIIRLKKIDFVLYPKYEGPGQDIK